MDNLELQKCVALLQKLTENGKHLEGLDKDLREALMRAAGQLSRPSREALRRRNKEIHKARREKLALADKQVRAQTGIREARRSSVFYAPPQLSAPPANLDATQELQTPRSC